jgi:hypothetical protein
MHLPLKSPLPRSFPVGAKYVVEGRGGKDGELRISRRYVVLPTGRRIDVSVDPVLTAGQRVFAARRNRGQRKATGHPNAPAAPAKKISVRRGTARQHAR